MSKTEQHLRLAGVTRLSVLGRGPQDAYVFDPHRLALPCWTLALEEHAAATPATLLTFDRHLDLVLPQRPDRVPDRSAGVLALDAHARLELDVRNVDHVLAAMEAGVVGDAIVVARSSPRGALVAESYRDTRGREHRWVVAPTLEQALDRRGALGQEGPLLLDIDLDAFTTPDPSEPGDLLPWAEPAIRAHLLPPQASEFWAKALTRVLALTLAREPYHCGGLIAAGRLFEVAAKVIFEELLEAEVP